MILASKTTTYTYEYTGGIESGTFYCCGYKGTVYCL